MTRMFHKAAIATALAATTVLTVTPAEAQRWGRHRYYDRGRDNAGVAIGAGLLGLGVGLALSQNRDRYYDRGYYGGGYDGYYGRGYGYGRPYYGGRGYYGQRCRTERVWDDWRGRWVRVRDCW